MQDCYKLNFTQIHAQTLAVKVLQKGLVDRPRVLESGVLIRPDVGKEYVRIVAGGVLHFLASDYAVYESSPLNIFKTKLLENIRLCKRNGVVRPSNGSHRCSKYLLSSFRSSTGNKASH